jgi:protein-disulfide isomerase
MQEKATNSQIFPTVVVLLLVAMAFGMGMMWQKLSLLQSGGTIAAGANNVAAGNAAPAAPGEIAQEAGEVDPVKKEDHVRGDRKARIALIEYSDLECPFCQQFHATADQLVKDYDGKLMWVYRHFPLSFHPQGEPRAIGAECAAKLGGEDKFWAFIDKVFEVQGFTGTPTEVAEKIGLNKSKFEECLKDSKIKDIVTAMANTGSKAGVNGTPGNILLDTKTGEKKLIPGALPAEQFKTIIDGMLAK